VVEAETDLVVGVNNSLISSSLELLNEVLVRALGEATALIGIKVDVVNPEGAVKEGKTANGIIKTTIFSTRDPEGLNGTELNIDLDFVVLESNEREGLTGVTAEVEVKGNVEDSAVLDIGIITAEVSSLTDHLVVSGLHAGINSEGSPDLEPVTEVAINTLTTDLELNNFDEMVTNIISPATRDGGLDLGELSLEENTVN
jgi:hypothetical protein